MARLTERESVIFGYSSQRSLFSMNDPGYRSSRIHSPDINFDDVFGGPPRRASIQEVCHSFRESSTPRNDGETTSSLRDSHRWSGLGDKPVFGDHGGSRRRYTNEDFFDDIFRGNNSLSSSFSPRKHDRDLFGSSPRVLSPARPLPPKSDSFGTPSLLAPFSLPAKLSNGTDLPTFGSSTRNLYKNKDGVSNGVAYSCSPLSRSSNQAQGELSQLTRQSSLREELYLSREEPSNVNKSDETDKGSRSKRHSNVSEVAANGKQFHFSIFKWASKGVPSTQPLSSRLKGEHKLERCSSAKGWIACESGARELPTEISCDADSVSFTYSGSSDTKQENGSLVNIDNRGGVEECQNVDIAILSNAKSETLITNPVNVTSCTFQNSEDVKTDSVPEMNLTGKTEEKTSSITQKDTKTELKPQCSLFVDQGIDLTTEKSKSKEIKARKAKKASAVFDASENVKGENEDFTALLNEDVDKVNLQGSPLNSQDNHGKNRVRGNVKNFVKIFNQEVSKETKSDVNSQNRIARRKEGGKFSKTQEASVIKNELREKMHLSNGNKNNMPAANVVANESPSQSEKLQHKTKTSKYKSEDNSSGLKDGSVSSSASIPDDPEAIVGDEDVPFQVNFLIKELHENEDKMPQTEEFQAIEATIRKWSNGKEGNIRSLLSTLQYVLWSGSGWKPVPLVDIIEGNAVKRSYQKALLCLHPDKLQQKCATSQQKYIAEKVFDILQEAWTHFNSLGSV